MTDMLKNTTYAYTCVVKFKTSMSVTQENFAKVEDAICDAMGALADRGDFTITLAAKEDATDHRAVFEDTMKRYPETMARLAKWQRDGFFL